MSSTYLSPCPRYNVSHVATRDPSTGQAWVGEVPGRSLYRATLLLGPLSLQAVCTSHAEAVSSLGPHIGSLLRTRDLAKLLEEEGEVRPAGYVAGQDIMRVVMECGGEGGAPAQVLPPLDLFLLQPKLSGGRLPAGYGVRDEYGCVKVVICSLCTSKIQAEHEAVTQVTSLW